jgi:hypothetical protein
MAFHSSSKNHTKTFSNQWFDTTFGLKASNVFGLGWSYYTASIKIITGVDISADIGWRCDFFFADTYKIGYANETVFGEGKRFDCHNKLAEFGILKQKKVENDNNVIDTVTNMIENKFDSIAVLDSTIGVQTIERESLIDSTTGAANFDASTMIVEAAISYLLDSPVFNVNGALEVLE